MGLRVLGDLLNDWQHHQLDDEVYLPVGTEPSLEIDVKVLPCDPHRPRVFEHHRYFLGIEQIRDVVEGLEVQLGRRAAPVERLRAVTHYAANDAFIDPRDAVGG